ncbi:phosphoribosyltransferase [Catelliglobosispora koreensis]|uniref:phosphoribosyltransferase n=1 Tax=Catelliglobosispora koreensis TaxID=129052 RepID=UPI000368B637|nr:phosphoribosyltransferase family protein [Catelliglobosispora koreensis]
MQRFADRVAAGRALAARLRHLRGQPLVVLGLPRGGVPVAFEVAQALQAPLDVIVVRKLGLPQQPEVAMGAIGEDGARVLNPAVTAYARQGDLERVEAAERAELEHRVALWRQGRPACLLAGHTAVIVDDGVATGATAGAACAVARLRGATRIVLAAPVIPADTVASLHNMADEVVTVLAPADFQAVGQWYADFTATSDTEVTRLLAEATPC